MSQNNAGISEVNGGLSPGVDDSGTKGDSGSDVGANGIGTGLAATATTVLKPVKLASQLSDSAAPSGVDLPQAEMLVEEPRILTDTTGTTSCDSEAPTKGSSSSGPDGATPAMTPPVDMALTATSKSPTLVNESVVNSSAKDDLKAATNKGNIDEGGKAGSTSEGGTTIIEETASSKSAPDPDSFSTLQKTSNSSKIPPASSTIHEDEDNPTKNDATVESNDETYGKLEELFDDTQVHEALRERNASLNDIRSIVEGHGKEQLTKYAPHYGGKKPGMLNMIPLHLAVTPSSHTRPSTSSCGGSGQSSLEIIQYLLEQDPESILKPAITLEAAQSGEADDTASTKTKTAYLPMHMACLGFTKMLGWQSYRINCFPSLDVVKFLHTSNPQAIATKDKTFGQLPIHVACGGVFGGGPADFHTSHLLIPRGTLNTIAGYDIIRFLVQQYPESVSVRDKVRGYTPLHYILESDGSRDIVTMELLKILATPDSLRRPDLHGRLPLHVACQNLNTLASADCRSSAYDKLSLMVENFPGALSVREKYYQQTPLDFALHNIKYASRAGLHDDDIVNLLSTKKVPLTAAAEKMANRSGNGTAQSQTHAAAAASSSRSHSAKSVSGTGGTGTNVTDLRNQWGEDGKKTDMELHHALRNWKPPHVIKQLIDDDPKRLKKFDTSTKFLPLHCACQQNGRFTLDSIKIIISKIPTSIQIFCGSNDVGYQLPLHVACQAKPHEQPRMDATYGGSKKKKRDRDTDSRVDVSIVQYLIEKHPQAVQLGGPKGLLPLHIACGSITNPSAASIGVIRLLISQYPKSTIKQETQFFGDTPVHRLCRYTTVPLDVLDLVGTQAALQSQNDIGQLPLHVACHNIERILMDTPDHQRNKDDSDLSNQESTSLAHRKFRLMVRRYPGALRECDQNGKTPFDIVCEAYSKNIEDGGVIDVPESIMQLLSTTKVNKEKRKLDLSVVAPVKRTRAEVNIDSQQHHSVLATSNVDPYDSSGTSSVDRDADDVDYSSSSTGTREPMELIGGNVISSRSLSSPSSHKVSDGKKKKKKKLSSGVNNQTTSTKLAAASSKAVKRKSSPDGKNDSRIREDQANNWLNQLEQVRKYVKKHGHGMIPHSYEPNQELARWAKRQRYQYKLYHDKTATRKSAMTPERIEALDRLGFCWDGQTMLWDDRYDEMVRFFETHGHANVPPNYDAAPKLFGWLKSQRRQYKQYKLGQPNTLSLARVKNLEKVGFVWDPSTGSMSPGDESIPHVDQQESE